MRLRRPLPAVQGDTLHIVGVGDNRIGKETTSSERLTALVEESDALARIVAKNPSAPVSLLRVLSRSEDEATRKNVILNPITPYDVLSELENQFTELFVNNPALESYNSMKL